MNRLLATLALGACMISTQSFAQERGDWRQQDMTRQQAQQRADSMFQRFDLNHDGIITRDEAQQIASQFGDRGARMVDRIFATAQSITLRQFEAQALARFDAEDLDHDGVLTPAERQQARNAMPAQRAAAKPDQ